MKQPHNSVEAIWEIFGSESNRACSGSKFSHSARGMGGLPRALLKKKKRLMAQARGGFGPPSDTGG